MQDNSTGEERDDVNDVIVLLLLICYFDLSDSSALTVFIFASSCDFAFWPWRHLLTSQYHLYISTNQQLDIQSSTMF